MQPLAYLVVWTTDGRVRTMPFVSEVGAEAWRARQYGAMHPLVACKPGESPDAWLVRYGDSMEHSAVTCDAETAMQYAVKLHGQRFPLRVP